MTAGLEHFFLNQYSTVEQLVHLRGEPRLLPYQLAVALAYRGYGALLAPCFSRQRLHFG